jgi:hypothetical protein
MSISSVVLAFLAPMARAKPDPEREIVALKIDLADARRELRALRHENYELRERIAGRLVCIENLSSCTPSRYRALSGEQAPLPPFFQPLPPSAGRI